MNVSVSRPTSGELSFAFDTDPTDAAAPLTAVWFRHDGVGQMGTLRIALMAYLMARPFIGNSFRLSGHPLPAHLASRLHQDLEADEFFVGPVTNVPEQILPDFQYDVLDGCAEDEWKMPSGGEASLTCRRNELGYVVEAVPGDEAPLLSIATNVDLFAAFTERPSLLSLVLIYLCAYDVLGVKRLRVRSVLDAQWLSRVDLLLAEVGGSMYVEPGRRAS
jgi:hypothetical protein